MVSVICPSRYKVNRKYTKQEAEEYLKKNDIANHNILNIIFVGKNKMRTVAVKYKNENEALPVLSFSYDQDKDGLFGEIFICYPQAVLLAAERNKKVDQIISWLVKHGIDNLVNSQ